MATLAARFVRQHPGLTLDIDLRDDQVDLNATEYDLWVRAGQIKSDQLIVREITRASRAIFCSPAFGTVTHPSELHSLRAIRLTPYVPESIRLTNTGGEALMLRQSCVMTTNNLYAAHAAAIEGIGYAVLPLWLTRRDVDRGTLAQTCPAWTPEPVVLSLAYLPGRNRPARIAALTKYLVQELSDAERVKSFFDVRLKALDEDDTDVGAKVKR